MKAKFILTVLTLFVYTTIIAQCPDRNTKWWIEKAANEPTEKNKVTAEFLTLKCQCKQGSENPEYIVFDINQLLDKYNSFYPKSRSGPEEKYKKCRPIAEKGENYFEVNNTKIEITDVFFVGKQDVYFEDFIYLNSDSNKQNPKKIKYIRFGPFKELEKGESYNLGDANLKIIEIQDHEDYWQFLATSGKLTNIGDNKYVLEGFFESKKGVDLPSYSAKAYFTYIPLH